MRKPERLSRDTRTGFSLRKPAEKEGSEVFGTLSCGSGSPAVMLPEDDMTHPIAPSLEALLEDPRELRRLSVLADVDPRTIRHFVRRDRGLKKRTELRVEQALRASGYPVTKLVRASSQKHNPRPRGDPSAPFFPRADDDRDRGPLTTTFLLWCRPSRAGQDCYGRSHI